MMAIGSGNGAILALDPATKTGYAVGVPGTTPTLGVVNLRLTATDEPEHIFKRARKWLDGLVAAHNPALLVVEGMVYTFGNTNQQTTDISRGLNGIYTSVDVPVQIAPIAVWRKYVLGQGNLKGGEAKKRMVALCKQFKWDAKDHNAAEAAGIWLWGCSIVNPRLVQRTEPLFLGTGL